VRRSLDTVVGSSHLLDYGRVARRDRVLLYDTTALSRASSPEGILVIQISYPINPQRVLNR